MTEYIERDMLYRVLERCRKAPKNRYQRGVEDGMELALNAIKAIHTADVAPVVRTEWVNPHWRNNDYCYDCSNCGGEAMHRVYRWRDEKIYPICPNCGARMYGGADNETD